MMSREVVSASVSVMVSVLLQLPMGVCNTKPRSGCNGPPSMISLPTKRLGVRLPVVEKMVSIVMGDGLLMVKPIAPCVLWLQRYTTL